MREKEGEEEGRRRSQLQLRNHRAYQKPHSPSSPFKMMIGARGGGDLKIRGTGNLKVSPTCSSLITPDIFKLLGPYESSGYPLSYAVW